MSSQPSRLLMISSPLRYEQITPISLHTSGTKVHTAARLRGGTETRPTQRSCHVRQTGALLLSRVGIETRMEIRSPNSAMDSVLTHPRPRLRPSGLTACQHLLRLLEED